MDDDASGNAGFAGINMAAMQNQMGIPVLFPGNQVFALMSRLVFLAVRVVGDESEEPDPEPACELHWHDSISMSLGVSRN